MDFARLRFARELAELERLLRLSRIDFEAAKGEWERFKKGNDEWHKIRVELKELGL